MNEVNSIEEDLPNNNTTNEEIILENTNENKRIADNNNFDNVKLVNTGINTTVINNPVNGSQIINTASDTKTTELNIEDESTLDEIGTLDDLSNNTIDADTLYNNDELVDNTVNNNQVIFDRVDTDIHKETSNNSALSNGLKVLGVGLAAGATYGTYKYVKNKKENEEENDDDFANEEYDLGGDI